ncbi:hypothetical protein ACWKW4_08065 [Hydrogenophaga borbori]
MDAAPIDAGQQKRLATVTAQLALQGFQAYPVATGGFFVSRWDRTKFCAALEDLEAFARQVGAAR